MVSFWLVRLIDKGPSWCSTHCKCNMLRYCRTVSVSEACWFEPWILDHKKEWLEPESGWIPGIYENILGCFLRLFSPSSSSCKGKDLPCFGTSMSPKTRSENILKLKGWNFQVPFFKHWVVGLCWNILTWLFMFMWSKRTWFHSIVHNDILMASRVTHDMTGNHEDPDLVSFPRQTKPIRKHRCSPTKTRHPQILEAWKQPWARTTPLGLLPGGLAFWGGASWNEHKAESYGKHNHLQKIPRKYRMVWRNFIGKYVRPKSSPPSLKSKMSCRHQV